MFLEDALRNLRSIKGGADAAMAQLSDEQFFALLDAESNSVAIVAKHMAGNLRSRFTDFLTRDGEKPDRNRDQEFIVDTDQALHPEDLAREVTIRSESHTVIKAINRQLMHHSLHAGQIILLAKHWKGADWKTLSIPRGRSETVNAAYAAKFKG